MSLGCNKSTAPSEPIDQHPTKILSVSADGQILDVQNAEAAVSIGQILKIEVTAIDDDTFTKYVITDDNSPANASVLVDVRNVLSDTLRTNTNFYADTASHNPYHVKPGDIIRQTFTFVDAFGFSKAQELTIHINQ